MANFIRNQDVSHSLIDDCIVILNLPQDAKDQDCYFHQLNETASFLWTCMQETTSEEQLLQKMLEEFDVDFESAEADLKSHLQQLNDLKLVTCT